MTSSEESFLDETCLFIVLPGQVLDIGGNGEEELLGIYIIRTELC